MHCYLLLKDIHLNNIGPCQILLLLNNEDNFVPVAQNFLYFMKYHTEQMRFCYCDGDINIHTTSIRVVELDLYGNNIGDQDAVAIAAALKYNTNLRLLCISDNSLTEVGHVALRRKAEFDKTSLNAAADSNHTCACDLSDTTVERTVTQKCPARLGIHIMMLCM